VEIVGSYMALGGITARRIIFYVIEAFLCLAVTHIFRMILNRRRWLFLPMHKLIPSVLAAVFIMGLMVYFLRIPINILLGRLFDPQIAFNAEQIFGQSSFYFILFFLWTVFYFTYHYFDRYNKSLKYEAKMTEIELNNLKSQLNPHFIFNVLASIQNKVLTGRKEVASAYIVKLSRLIRNFLNASYRSNEGHGQEYDISLETEIELLNAYLEFEQDKSDRHFDFHIEVDSTLTDSNATLPPMLIQPFVENAIKHGLLPAPPGGILGIRFARTDQALTCSVSDDGIGRAEAARRAKQAFRTHRSLGTKMIEERIELLNQLGHHISVETSDRHPNGTLVRITIGDS